VATLATVVARIRGVHHDFKHRLRYMRVGQRDDRVGVDDVVVARLAHELDDRVVADTRLRHPDDVVDDGRALATLAACVALRFIEREDRCRGGEEQQNRKSRKKAFHVGDSPLADVACMRTVCQALPLWRGLSREPRSSTCEDMSSWKKGSSVRRLLPSLSTAFPTCRKEGRSSISNPRSASESFACDRR